MNKKYIDNIVYYWAVLFILPIVSTLLLNFQDVIRNFNYAWAFLFVIYLIKNRASLLNINNTISKKAITIFFIVSFISIAYSQISKLYAFRVNAYDFGIFQSMLESALNGHWGYSNVVNFYHFGTHQNYILLTILPLYAIFRSPIFLQLVTTTLIILPSIMLWLITYKRTNPLFAFMLALGYLLSPFNGMTNDFKPELFGPVLFIFSYFFYSRRQFTYFILFSVLFLLTSEECSLYLFGFGVYLLFKKDYKYCIIAISTAITIVLINNMIVQPYFVHKSAMITPTTLGFFSAWGTSKSEIAINMLTHPFKVIACIFNLNSGFWRLYTPFLFLPLLDPFLLCSGFLATILYATSNSDTMVHYNHYHALLLNLILFISLSRISLTIYLAQSSFELFNVAPDLLNVDNVAYQKSQISNELSIHKNNSELSLIKKIFASVDKYSSCKKITFLLLLTCFPLWGIGFQEFYPIRTNEIHNFLQVKQFLYKQYNNADICPQENLLPLFLSEKLRIRHDGDMFNSSKPCVIVFTTLGDSWPYTRPQIEKEVQARKPNCKVFGAFYVCQPM